MKKSVLFLAAAVLTGGLAASFAQASTLDVVRDVRGNVVCTKDGSCVRTKWENGVDACHMTAEEKVAQNAKVYFAFGSSKLTPEGKKTLDQLVADIKASGPAVAGVRVSGFADRIGGATKNEKLSKKRADTVRKYLVSKGVTSAQVLETKWFGDSAAKAPCPSKMKKAALIKCLQEDRRVEVDVDYVPED